MHVLTGTQHGLPGIASHLRVSLKLQRFGCGPKGGFCLPFPPQFFWDGGALEGTLVFISLEASIRKECGGREMRLSGTQMDVGI